MKMNNETKYFIKIIDHIRNNEQIINCEMNITNYMDNFNIIINYLNKDSPFVSTITNDKAEIFKQEEIQVRGYFYNTKRIKTTLIYELKLVEINNYLSSLFNLKKEKESQTDFIPELESVWNENEQFEEKDHQDDQDDQDDHQDDQRDNDSFTSLELNSECDQCEELELDEIYMRIKKKAEHCLNKEEINKNLDYYSMDFNYPPVYSSIFNNNYSNVIIPEYNPFKNIMNIRGDNDMYFSLGSEVPKIPTKPIVKDLITNNWTPELIDELKYRLSQPNAGLVPTNITSYYC
jgi:hypothetical protein